MSRTIHQYFKKTSKALAAANTRAAEFETHNKRLYSQLEALKP
jgi:hypothetical protein